MYKHAYHDLLCKYVSLSLLYIRSNDVNTILFADDLATLPHLLQTVSLYFQTET